MNSTTNLFTVGHSNHPLDRFPALLARHGVEALVDIRRFPASIQFHQHVFPLDLDGKAPHPFVGERAEGCPGPDVEFRVVPGAGDDHSHQRALPQRPAFVGAGVVDGVEGAGHVEEGDAAPLGATEGRWEELAVVADALEDAGCTDAKVLALLRNNTVIAGD
jgi:hypothetical protein